jgi:hypothetical protein
MFILNRMKGADTSDNTPNVLTVSGRLDRRRFEDVVDQLIRRHETFRTSFDLIGEEPVQRVHEEVLFELGYREGAGVGVEELIEEFVRPFDLGSPPLMRVELVHMDEESHLLLYDIHHIITDDASGGIFVREFISLYEGDTLPFLRLQYKDYAYWQDELVETGGMRDQELYWLGVFSGELPVLNMPTDFSRPEVQSYAGDYVGFRLDRELTKRLKELVVETESTLFMVIMAIYNILLSKICGQEDIVVGIPIAGRPHIDLEHVVGFFVNTLALRNFPKGEKCFLEFLGEVKHNSLKAYENQDYQFEELVAKLKFERDTSRHPLFDTMLNVHLEEVRVDKRIESLVFGGYQFKANVTQSDFMIHVIDGDEIYFKWVFGTKIYRRDTVERITKYFLEIASEVLNDINIKLGDISISHGLFDKKLDAPEINLRF